MTSSPCASLFASDYVSHSVDEVASAVVSVTLRMASDLNGMNIGKDAFIGMPPKATERDSHVVLETIPRKVPGKGIGSEARGYR
jgi:hypothetical protein